MWQKVTAILDFLNVLDEDGKGLSWTTIGLVSMLIKVFVSPILDGPSVVALCGLLVNYVHRRAYRVKGVSDDRQSMAKATCVPPGNSLSEKQ